jgi:hypothetical protein
MYLFYNKTKSGREKTISKHTSNMPQGQTNQAAKQAADQSSELAI